MGPIPGKRPCRAVGKKPLKRLKRKSVPWRDAIIQSVPWRRYFVTVGRYGNGHHVAHRAEGSGTPHSLDLLSLRVQQLT
jgi:hypothetical protein